ncbi:MAG: 4-hydroxy-tetrahydrodipicolinate reductase [Chloroflexi bacterium]|nr:4-hydroxy-tetrahydrodipicolinate reductase [Chloroflexota bacterium]
MNTISVVVHGALGRVGREVINAVSREPGMKVVGAVEIKSKEESLPLPDDAGSVPLSSDLDKIISTCQPDVLVDFTVAPSTMKAIPIVTQRKVNLVIGTTGLTENDLKEIDRLATANGVGAFVAPNFALGAVIMMHLASIAAKYFDYAEVIELHHHQKVDSPSGTALSTARAMAKSRGKPFTYVTQKGDVESRGKQVDGIAIHSIRLPGLMAHQEVILGTAGQTLSIRHDTINRECYMPGVLLAIKEVGKHKGLVYGLDTLLGLE